MYPRTGIYGQYRGIPLYRRELMTWLMAAITFEKTHFSQYFSSPDTENQENRKIGFLLRKYIILYIEPREYFVLTEKYFAE